MIAKETTLWKSKHLRRRALLDQTRHPLSSVFCITVAQPDVPGKLYKRRVKAIKSSPFFCSAIVIQRNTASRHVGLVQVPLKQGGKRHTYAVNLHIQLWHETDSSLVWNGWKSLSTTLSTQSCTTLASFWSSPQSQLNFFNEIAKMLPQCITDGQSGSVFQSFASGDQPLCHKWKATSPFWRPRRKRLQ